jgi:hypothetical protein
MIVQGRPLLLVRIVTLDLGISFRSGRKVFPLVLSTPTRTTESPVRPGPEQAAAHVAQKRGGSAPTTSG